MAVIRSPPAELREQRNAETGADRRLADRTQDADERVTPELAGELQQIVRHPTCAAYQLPRLTWHLG